MTKSHTFEHLSMYFKLVSVFFILLTFVLTSISAPATAGQLYRYKNEQGNAVLNHTIPAEFVSKGYDILNEKGRLLKTVPPALTTQEIRVRDAAREQEKLRLIAKQKQDIIDHELKQLYSHPNDAVRILQRRVLDIHSVIQIKTRQIENNKKQILSEESAAAQRQRKGLNVTDKMLGKIDAFKKDITHAKADMEELTSELSKVQKEFDAKIKRLEVITGKEATDYPALLDSLHSNQAAMTSSEFHL